MHLLPHWYFKLALALRTDELIAAGMKRRQARITAVFWLLKQSLSSNNRVS